MLRRTTLSRSLLCSGVLCLAATAQAQPPLSVRPAQNLSFGTLLPGVPSTVDAMQLTQSGQLDVRAGKGAVIEIRYTLPTAMTGAGGALPLVFGRTSAAVTTTGSQAGTMRFDPNVATRIVFTSNKATFLLGGQARPLATQRAGAYTATVVVTITNLGL